VRAGNESRTARRPEEDRFADLIAAADPVRLSAASYVEASIYVERHGDEIWRAMLDTFIREFSIRIEPVTAEQAMLARHAFALFGKGRHKAGRIWNRRRELRKAIADCIRDSPRSQVAAVGIFGETALRICCEVV
jgi:hypothetical protein